MDFSCYLKDNCRCRSNQNSDLLVCFGCECEVHDLCGDYDEDGHLWCFSCSKSGRYKVGALLTKNREDYLEESLYAFIPKASPTNTLPTISGVTAEALIPNTSPTKAGATTDVSPNKSHEYIGDQVLFGDAAATSKPCSNVAVAFAAEALADTSLPDSGNFMDSKSILDVDAYTNFFYVTQGTNGSDTSSIILEHDMAHYVAAIEGAEKLLIYPFLGAHRVELAAKALSLCDFNASYNDEQLISLQLQSSVGRNQIITFYDFDRNSLNKGTYVNDNVIDFWMLWISRNIPSTMSNILILSTHFYSEMLSQGVETVSGWSLHKNRDVFSFKIILLPVNLDNHWSLCGIYYANKIELLPNSNAHNNERPFMMHLDSLNYHSAGVISKNVRMWLNYEWKKRSGLERDLPNPSNFPIIRPKGKLCDVVFVHSSIVHHCFLENIFASASFVQSLNRKMVMIAACIYVDLHMNYIKLGFKHSYVMR
jgi:hypothetical protein